MTYRNSFNSPCFRANGLGTYNFSCCGVTTIIRGKVDFPGFSCNYWNIHGRMNNCWIPLIDFAFGMHDSFWCNILVKNTLNHINDVEWNSLIKKVIWIGVSFLIISHRDTFQFHRLLRKLLINITRKESPSSFFNDLYTLTRLPLCLNSSGNYLVFAVRELVIDEMNYFSIHLKFPQLYVDLTSIFTIKCVIQLLLKLEIVRRYMRFWRYKTLVCNFCVYYCFSFNHLSGVLFEYRSSW